MNITAFFKNNWKHFAAIGVFAIISMIYFYPEYSGYELKQHDVEMYNGMSNEIWYYRDKTGTEPLWTNSMFGGMPATQISLIYDGNIFQRMLIAYSNFTGTTGGKVFLYFLGFYIMMLFLSVRPIIGFIGSLAFAFASYNIIIIQAGHNSKATAMALMAPVVGAFLYTFRSNWKWGAAYTALFLAFQLAANHLQVTYYMGFLLLGLGIYQFVQAIRSKELKNFFLATGASIGAVIVAFVINYGNISMTYDYSEHTIRGKNDVTLNPDQTESKVASEGLDRDYITNWSYGVDESFTLVSPNVKGSASVGFAGSQFQEQIENSDLSSSDINKVLNAPYPVYWGEQPMTSGPVYIGVVLLFLAFLGMYYIKDNSKWVYLAVSILALALSWGKNFMGLTDFFIDNVPGYNKFRTVTIILIMVELCIPVIAVLLLERLYRERENIVASKKQFLILSGIFFVFLFGLKVVGLGDNFTNTREMDQISALPDMVKAQIAKVDKQTLVQQYGVDPSNPQQIQQFIDAQVDSSEEQYELVKSARKGIFDSSMNRSLIFAVFAIGLMALYFYTSVSTVLIFGGVGALIAIDLITVDVNYLSAETDEKGEMKYWATEPSVLYPFAAVPGDYMILEMEMMNPSVAKAVREGEKIGNEKADKLGYTGGDKRRVVDNEKFRALNSATNYRVFDFDGGWSSARASYFHKSLGGYHGAKLQNIQNLFDYHISRSNNKVLDMLNVRYLIQNGEARPNATAKGNAWFVQKVETHETPNEEIAALGNQFIFRNNGPGRFVVNGKEVKEATIYGAEKLGYLMDGNPDTMEVRLVNGLTEGVEAYWVMDTNRNTNFIPKEALAADQFNSFKKLLELKVTNEFKVNDEAVMLASEAAKLKSKSFSGKGTINLVSYAPNKLVYKAKCEGSQLAVFSEIYYPEGWSATVDGKPSDIRKVNYLLRGVELEGGNHEIVFTFDIPKLKKTNSMALAATAVIALVFGLLIFLKFKSPKSEATAE